MAEKMFGQEESREDEPACGESLCVRPHQLCVPLLFHSVRQWWEREPFLPSFLPSYFLPSFLPSAWLHLCIPLCSSHWIVRSVSQAGFAVAAVSVHVCLCTCMHSWLCDCLCLCMWARLCVCGCSAGSQIYWSHQVDPQYDQRHACLDVTCQLSSSGSYTSCNAAPRPQVWVSSRQLLV